MNIRFKLLLAAIASVGLLSACGERPPVQSVQLGYRGTGMEVNYNPRLLKIVAETWDDYQKFLTTRLTSAPNVSHVKSMMVFRTAKQTPGVPISTE